MATGLEYNEVFEANTYEESLGKITASRLFRVETTSPAAALATIQEDAGLDYGTSYSEPVDDFTSHGGSPAAKVAGYSVEQQTDNACFVRVTYEDQRFTVRFDEASAGFLYRNFSISTVQESVSQALSAYEQWDADNQTGAQVNLNPGYTEVYDRTLGWDGSNGNPVAVDFPQLIYSETWNIGDAAVGTYTNGGTYTDYVPGMFELITNAGGGAGDDRLTNDINRRLGLYPAEGEVESTRYYLWLFAATGMVNSTEWKGFPPATLLSLPPIIEQTGQATWRVTYQYAFSPYWRYDSGEHDNRPINFLEGTNVTTLASYDTSGLDKYGWEALWFGYTSDSSGRAITHVAVGQIYYLMDFYKFGIGYNTLTSWDSE